MIDIPICALGIVGIFTCQIIENIMWELDREKDLGYDMEWNKSMEAWVKGENNATPLDN